MEWSSLHNYQIMAPLNLISTYLFKDLTPVILLCLSCIISFSLSTRSLHFTDRELCLLFPCPWPATTRLVPLHSRTSQKAVITHYLYFLSSHSLSIACFPARELNQLSIISDLSLNKLHDQFSVLIYLISQLLT